MGTNIELQPTSQNIWEQKYKLYDNEGGEVDKTVEDSFKRVAKSLSACEEDSAHWYKEFLWALKNGATPAGRILANAGAEEYKPSASLVNCTTGKIVEDSVEGIMQSNSQAAITLSSGAGIGYEMSTIRPSGALVSGVGAYTTGPLPFMDIFDKMCFTISSAGGRRGAQIATFAIWHPDVEAFITAKKETGRFRQFNLSVLITDDFIEAVKEDKDWKLFFPASKAEKGDKSLEFVWKDMFWEETYCGEAGYTVKDNKILCKVYKTVRAKDIWETLMRTAYDYAEPGFLLIDKANRENNNYFCERLRACNPCVTADTWVQTNKGARQVSDLIGKPFIAQVDGVSYASGKEGFFKTTTKAVVNLQTKEGYKLRLTPNHRVRRRVGSSRYDTETEWCEASNLKVGDCVLLNKHKEQEQWQGEYTEEQGYLLGLLIGDGTLKQDAAVLSVWKQVATANDGVNAVMVEALRAAKTLPHRSDFKGWSEVTGRNEYRLSLSAIYKLAREVGMQAGDKVISPKIEKASSEFYKGFLRGFFDTDGSVQGTQEKGVSVRLSQSDLPRLEAVQRMLLRLGIVSTIYKNRRPAGTRMLPNGRGGVSEYKTKANHELVVSGENLTQFKDKVGFIDTRKATRLQQALASYKRKLNRECFFARVEEVTEEGVEAVYDVQITGINTFDANGLHAHNCGEQILPPHGSCLLGSINLTKFVLNPFTEEASFDWDTYNKVIAIFTRMLDNVVELNGLPLEEQRAEILSKRRHGMGYLGLGSCLSLLGINYGSEEAISFTGEVTKVLALGSYREGVKLAKAKGMAPLLAESDNLSLWCKGVFMQRVIKADEAEGGSLGEDLKKYGCRFTHANSVAPTGTLSLSVGNNCSAGIEQSFAHKYTRNVIVQGKKSKEAVEVCSYELLVARSLGKEEEVVFQDATDITPEQHIAMQAAAQTWIDSSISKTIQIPTEAPFDEFRDVFLKAYDAGLKGVTCFRFNPEVFQGVLVKDEDLKKTLYEFKTEDGNNHSITGDTVVEYDGEIHTAANLYDAIKEGYYGNLG